MEKSFQICGFPKLNYNETEDIQFCLHLLNNNYDCNLRALSKDWFSINDYTNLINVNEYELIKLCYELTEFIEDNRQYVDKYRIINYFELLIFCHFAFNCVDEQFIHTVFNRYLPDQTKADKIQFVNDFCTELVALNYTKLIDEVIEYEFSNSNDGFLNVNWYELMQKISITVHYSLDGIILNKAKQILNKNVYSIFEKTYNSLTPSDINSLFRSPQRFKSMCKEFTTEYFRYKSLYKIAENL